MSPPGGPETDRAPAATDALRSEPDLTEFAPNDAAAAALMPTRHAIEALVRSVRDPAHLPLWARSYPSSPAEFFAALVVRVPGVDLVYDESDRLLWVKGIRLRGAVA